MRHIAPYLGLFRDTAKYFKAGKKDFTILEIGVARGSSTEQFLKGLKARHDKGDWGEGVLYSIDIDDCSNNVRENKEFWTFIHGDSKEIKWDKPIDVLFIDGDHSYEGAKADFLQYISFVVPGGLVYMHDVIHPRYGVNQLWKEIDLPKVVLSFNPSGLGVITIPK
jgi:predicted O-methyltransferase YrrM